MANLPAPAGFGFARSSSQTKAPTPPTPRSPKQGIPLDWTSLSGDTGAGPGGLPVNPSYGIPTLNTMQQLNSGIQRQNQKALGPFTEPARAAQVVGPIGQQAPGSIFNLPWAMRMMLSPIAAEALRNMPTVIDPSMQGWDGQYTPGGGPVAYPDSNPTQETQGHESTHVLLDEVRGQTTVEGMSPSTYESGMSQYGTDEPYSGDRFMSVLGGTGTADVWAEAPVQAFQNSGFNIQALTDPVLVQALKEAGIVSPDFPVITREQAMDLYWATVGWGQSLPPVKNANDGTGDAYKKVQKLPGLPRQPLQPTSNKFFNTQAEQNRR